MVQYFLIPKIHELLLANAINNWFVNPQAWSVVTGVYKESEIIDFSDTLVKNKTISGTENIIKNGYKEFMTNKNYLLNAFLVEGDLELFTPDFYNEILLIQDILIFNTAQDYINYINTQ